MLYDKNLLAIVAGPYYLLPTNSSRIAFSPSARDREVYLGAAEVIDRQVRNDFELVSELNVEALLLDLESDLLNLLVGQGGRKLDQVFGQ